jgi:hypothetical protein
MTTKGGGRKNISLKENIVRRIAAEKLIHAAKMKSPRTPRLRVTRAVG